MLCLKLGWLKLFRYLLLKKSLKGIGFKLWYMCKYIEDYVIGYLFFMLIEFFIIFYVE